MSTPLLRRIVSALIAVSVQAEAAQDFPKHWGEPPRIQTRDYRPLPGGFGFGSSTLAHWIQQNLDRDATGGPSASRPRGVSVGKGAVADGELVAARPVTLVLDGPPDDGAKHDYRVTVRFIHKSGAPEHKVTATLVAGGAKKWQARFTPEKAGPWIYRVSFLERASGGEKRDMPVEAFHGRSGTIGIAAAP